MKKYLGFIIFTAIILLLIYVAKPVYYKVSIYSMLSLLLLFIILSNVIKFLIIRNLKGKFFLCDVIQTKRVYNEEESLKKYEVFIEVVMESKEERKIIKFEEDISPKNKYYVYYSMLRPNYYIVFSRTAIFKSIICILFLIVFLIFTFISLQGNSISV
jgi:hypothetical protein